MLQVVICPGYALVGCTRYLIGALHSKLWARLAATDRAVLLRRRHLIDCFCRSIYTTVSAYVLLICIIRVGRKKAPARYAAQQRVVNEARTRSVDFFADFLPVKACSSAQMGDSAEDLEASRQRKIRENKEKLQVGSN